MIAPVIAEDTMKSPFLFSRAIQILLWRQL